MNTKQLTARSIHKQKLAEADKSMRWYKAIVFVVMPFSILLAVGYILFTTDPFVLKAIFTEHPNIYKEFLNPQFIHFAVLMFVFFELGWHLYVFSRVASVYFVIVLAMLVFSFWLWQPVFYLLDRIVFFVRIALAIISMIYFKKRWYMFDSIEDRAELRRARNDS